jgi:hypothetical protein
MLGGALSLGGLQNGCAVAHGHNTFDFRVDWHVQGVVLLQAAHIHKIPCSDDCRDGDVLSTASPSEAQGIAMLCDAKVSACVGHRCLNCLSAHEHDSLNAIAILKVQWRLKLVGNGRGNDGMHSMQEVEGGEPG